MNKEQQKVVMETFAKIHEHIAELRKNAVSLNMMNEDVALIFIGTSCNEEDKSAVEISCALGGSDMGLVEALVNSAKENDALKVAIALAAVHLVSEAGYLPNTETVLKNYNVNKSSGIVN